MIPDRFDWGLVDNDASAIDLDAEGNADPAVTTDEDGVTLVANSAPSPGVCNSAHFSNLASDMYVYLDR